MATRTTDKTHTPSGPWTALDGGPHTTPNTDPAAAQHTADTLGLALAGPMDADGAWPVTSGKTLAETTTDNAQPKEHTIMTTDLDAKTVAIDNRLRALLEEQPTIEQLRHVVVVVAEEMRRLGKEHNRPALVGECRLLRKTVGA